MNGTRLTAYAISVIGIACLSLTASGDAQTPPPAQASRAIEADGTVNVPAFRLPPSVYASAEARKALPRSASDFGAQLDRAVSSGAIPKMRESMPKVFAPALRRLAEMYPTRSESVVIAGVKGVRILPAAGVTRENRGKILLNLPGGAFLTANAEGGGLMESVPLAATARIEILSITYRQAPEAKFPAASEDVAAVYRELLKTHKPQDVGIFGCSAGGLLTAQALAWFQNEKLPTPGAAGIFCASADARWGGDSWYWQRSMHGLTSAPTLDERFYYGDHDLSDPLMSPMESDAVLRRFPPTLIITASRAGEFSSAIDTHRRLVRDGVDAELHVWDGLDHGFFQDPTLPESREAFDVMSRFFLKNLGKSRH
jgi:acetyl esterase/lipase